MAQDLSYLKNIGTRAVADNMSIDTTKFFQCFWNSIFFHAMDGNPYMYLGQTLYSTGSASYANIFEGTVDNEATYGTGKIVAILGYNKRKHGEITYVKHCQTEDSARLVMLTSNGYVLGLGENDNGWLNQGNNTRVTNRLLEIYDPADYSNDKATKTRINDSGRSNGGAINVIYILTAGGKIWACGDGSNGKLGQNSTSDSNTLVQTQDGSGVSTGWVDFETGTGSGSTTCIAVKTDGSWHALGDGGTEITGGGNSSTDRLVWTSISELPTKAHKKFMVFGSTSKSDCLVLYNDGDLYHAGNNASGIADNGNTTSVHTYALIRQNVDDFHVTIKENASTQSVLTEEGTDIFGIGENAQGQLPNGNNTDQRNFVAHTSDYIPSGYVVQNIWTATHSCAGYLGMYFYRLYNSTTGDYKVYVKGYNGYNGFGNGTSTSTSTSSNVPYDLTPHLPCPPEDILEMQIQGYTGGQQGGWSAIITKQGELYGTGDVWGSNGSGVYANSYNNFPYSDGGQVNEHSTFQKITLHGTGNSRET